METGGEILYPWVSRMIMLGLYVTGKVPFEAVYIHGYVMAEDGAKMSKSLGNVINPIDVINQYGSDALRIGIIASRAPAVNRGYDSRKVEDARNFCNKLWNIARYIEDRVGDIEQLDDVSAVTDADHWILHNLRTTSDAVADNLENYRFAEALDTLYHFVWDDLADWYVEASKTQENTKLLAYILDCVLRIMHPFAPFVTETIWQTLPWQQDTLLVSASWPTVPEANQERTKAFETVKSTISEVRSILKNLGLTSSQLEFSDEPAIADNIDTIKRMARLTEITEVNDSTGLRLTESPVAAWLLIAPDVAMSYVTKLQDNLQAEDASKERLEGRLGNKSYVDNAPTAVVEQTKQQLEDAQLRMQAIQNEIDRFIK